MINLMPAIFLGHGNPMNALLINNYTKAWRRLAKEIPRPKAIVVVSAHWFVAETAVTNNDPQKTLHDFVGFPQALYEFNYPAPGDPVLAKRVKELLAPETKTSPKRGWGLDHGTWSILCHMYPAADIPVIQLSIDETKSASFHFAIGEKLATLREEGILIIGSGNLVHNLSTYAWGKPLSVPYDWAVRFENAAKAAILSGDNQTLIDYKALGKDAALSIPTPEHYLPMLYILGTRRPSDTITFPVAGVDGGSISMLAVKVG